MTTCNPNIARRPFSLEGVTSNGASIPAATAEKKTKYRVLIVEDDVAIAHMIAANLHKAGLEFHCAATGVLGVQAFEESPFHLVLLDLMLPGMNGFDVCQAIRQQSRVPVVMMTARSENTHQMRGFRVGADDFVLKPFDPQVLVARVIAHLRRSYAYDERMDLVDGVAAAEESPAWTTEAAARQAALRQAGIPVLESQKDGSLSMPAGWACCSVCQYMGPLERFARRANGHGQNVSACPHCGAEKTMQFAVS